MKRITAIAILATLFAAGSINLAHADLKEAVVADAAGKDTKAIWMHNPHADAGEMAETVKAASELYGKVYDQGILMCGPDFVSKYQTAVAAGNTKVAEQLAGTKLYKFSSFILQLKSEGVEESRAQIMQSVMISACFQYNIVNK